MSGGAVTVAAWVCVVVLASSLHAGVRPWTAVKRALISAGGVCLTARALSRTAREIWAELATASRQDATATAAATTTATEADEESSR